MVSTPAPGSMAEAQGPRRPRRKRTIDRPRLSSFEALRRINGEGGYANLVTAEVIAGLDARDAGFVTELVHGTCRRQGSYDMIIERAAGRTLNSLQPAVVDVLRLACHQLFVMRVPMHAAVAASVDLAGVAIGERVTGVVNAILRKLAASSWDEWLAELTVGLPERASLAIRHAHPQWIVEAFATALASDDAERARLLEADNEPPVPMLAVRPGLADVAELTAGGAEPARWSPWAASRPGNPGDLPAVRQGRAGVQDEGSQLVVKAATGAGLPEGPWLDLCAGPGGKSALLRGLAPGLLVSAEVQPHRAELVGRALRAYPQTGTDGRAHQVVVADGRFPAWQAGAFGLVLADVPCTGLGSLRRRPESRWRRDPAALGQLVELQTALLASAIDSTQPGGLVAYITCSPHRAETVDVIAEARGVQLLDAPALLPEVPAAASRLNPRCLQLWPHVHGTDARFCALLRRHGG